MEETHNNSIENDHTLIDMISKIWEFKGFIISLTLMGALISVAFSIATIKLPLDKNPLPNVYRAYTKVLIQEGSAGGNNNLSLMIDMLGMGNSGNQIISSGDLTQMVYYSYPFADNVIKEFDLIDNYKIEKDIKTNSRRLFYRNSTFSYDNRTGELTLSFDNPDRYLATEIVLFMLEALQRWFHEQGGAVSQSQLVSIESKLLEVSGEINSLEDKIKRMQLKYGVLNIEDLAQSQQLLVSNLNEQLMNLDLQISQQANSNSSYSPVEQGIVRTLRGEREDVALTLRNLEAGLPVGNKSYPPAKELPNIALEFTQLQLLHEIQREIYMSLTEQYEILKLSKGGDLSFTILEPAEIPEQKYSPKRSEMCIQITLGSFVLGVCLAYLFSYMKERKIKIESGSDI